VNFFHLLSSLKVSFDKPAIDSLGTSNAINAHLIGPTGKVESASSGADIKFVMLYIFFKK